MPFLPESLKNSLDGFQYPNRPTGMWLKSGSSTVANGRPIKKWAGDK